MTANIALTGATGFVGHYLANTLTDKGYTVRALLRRPTDQLPNLAGVHIGDIEQPLNLDQALRDVDYVIHSAGIAHTTGRPEQDYRAVNIEGTRNLAIAAKKAGIKRFIFLSSVQAQIGPSSAIPVTDDMPPHPTNAYGRSKLEAEEALNETGIEWAAVRPALIYGKGVKGNMASLMGLAQSKWPLPNLSAKRSVLSLPNLFKAIETLMKVEKPLRRPFLVADDDPLTIGEILSVLRKAQNRSPQLLPFPNGLCGWGLDIIGQSHLKRRLFEDLVVVPQHLKEIGWRPVTATPKELSALLSSS